MFISVYIYVCVFTSNDDNSELYCQRCLYLKGILFVRNVRVRKEIKELECGCHNIRR